MIDFDALLARLCSERVKFLIVGGVAATIHGSARLAWLVTLAIFAD